MANRMHSIVRIQKLALEKEGGFTDGKELYMVHRFDADVAGLERAEFTKLADNAVNQVKSLLFPVERAQMALDIAEAELRADLLDALKALDVSTPVKCREVFEMHRELASSQGAPSLRNAVDMLVVAGLEDVELVSGLARRLQELYPDTSGDE